MDDYKEKLITLVHARPLLWNPRVPDYKDKEQKAQVWGELAKILPEPKGTTHKDTWESLIRCHCNALQRTLKRSARKADQDSGYRPWKFLKHMEFLIPIKDIRYYAKGFLPVASVEDSETDADSLPAAGAEAGVARVGEGEEEDVPTELGLLAGAGQVRGSEQGGGTHNNKKKKKRKVEGSANDLVPSLLGAKEERTAESPRMGFFHSIMPRVDSLQEEVFQEFQLQTLLLLKNLHAQQTQQPH